MNKILQYIGILLLVIMTGCVLFPPGETPTDCVRTYHHNSFGETTGFDETCK